MTLLKYHGFEGYDNPVDQEAANDLITFVGSQEGSAYVAYATGRNGGKALRHTGTIFSMYAYLSFPAIAEEAIIGFAFYADAYPSVDSPLLHMANGTSAIGSLQITNRSTGILDIALTQVDPIGRVYFPYNTKQWYYVEAKLRIHDTLGMGVVRIDEQEIFSLTGQDTRWSSNPTIVATMGLGFPKAVDFRYDDLYIANNEGSENNDFLGDIRVDQIRPNGAGNYTQLTPSAGANYECVDDVTLDEANYVEGITAGNKDSYAYANVPTDLDDAGIIGLQIKNNSQRTATASNIKIDPFIRTGSTDYSQTALDLSDAISMVDGDIILDDPSDSNVWTQAKINACEFGMEVAS